ncbi:MAG: pyridoxamine 5'-phosphate oxidase family protein [Actinomycetota bacterium]|nr:pyridoxamine 5'-phosphate oxidase family protein [Actinomycetota bacterium]
MSVQERDAFLMEPRLGTISVSRVGRGPLPAPIWYSYVPGTVDMCIGATSAKAHRFRAEGRATLSVVDPGSTGLYRYVAVEGPVTLSELGDDTRDAMLRMSTRYLGADAGQRYADNFMKDLVNDDLHKGHGTTELRAPIQPALWHSEILG